MEIARETTRGSVMVKDIAARQQLPATYLEQVMVPLRKSGLVSATRGAHGGYRLSRPAAGMTLHEIIESLDGPLMLIDCADIPSCRQDQEMCALKEILDDASRAMVDALRRITLSELLARQQQKDSAGAVMYEI